jgi:hypothetical protein
VGLALAKTFGKDGDEVFGIERMRDKPETEYTDMIAVKGSEKALKMGHHLKALTVHPVKGDARIVRAVQ